MQTCCVSIAAEGPEAKRCLPDSEKLPQSPTRASRRLPSAPTFMGRKKLPCTGRFKSRRRLQGRNTHTPAFRPAASHPSSLPVHQIPDSQTQTCEARAGNGDRGNHQNHLVGGSISLKLLFTPSPAGLRGKRGAQSEKRLFVFRSGRKTS